MRRDRALQIAHGQEEFVELDGRRLGRRIEADGDLVAHERHDIGESELLLDLVQHLRRQRRWWRRFDALWAGLGDALQLLRQELARPE